MGDNNANVENERLREFISHQGAMSFALSIFKGDIWLLIFIVQRRVEHGQSPVEYDHTHGRIHGWTHVVEANHWTTLFDANGNTRVPDCS